MNQEDHKNKIWDIVDILNDQSSEEYAALMENKELLRAVMADAFMSLAVDPVHTLNGVSVLSFVAGYIFANEENLEEIVLEEDIWGSLDDYLGLSEEE